MRPPDATAVAAIVDPDFGAVEYGAPIQDAIVRKYHTRWSSILVAVSFVVQFLNRVSNRTPSTAPSPQELMLDRRLTAVLRLGSDSGALPAVLTNEAIASCLVAQAPARRLATSRSRLDLEDDEKGSSEYFDGSDGGKIGSSIDQNKLSFDGILCSDIRVNAVPVLPGSTPLRDAVAALQQVGVPMAVENGGELLGIVGMADVFASLAEQMMVSRARALPLAQGSATGQELALGGGGAGAGAGAMFGHLGADGQLKSSGSLVARSPWAADGSGILTTDANSSFKQEHVCSCLDTWIAGSCQEQSNSCRSALESLVGQGVILFLLTADICLAVADLLVGNSSMGIRTATIVVLCLFVAEIVIRLVAYGSRFLNTYALLDISVVLISLVEIALFELFLTNFANASTRAVIIILGRTLRLIRVVRGITRFISHQREAMSKTKKLVSQNKRRFTGSGWDLDLTFISDRCAAMSVPVSQQSGTLEGLVRNPLEKVAEFLDLRHPGCYCVYNLCSETQYDYDPAHFHGRVVRVPFDDHMPPSLAQLVGFCKQSRRYLKQSPLNVVVVHCKGGKGRTGVMVASHLLDTRRFATGLEALEWFSNRRTEVTAASGLAGDSDSVKQPGAGAIQSTGSSRSISRKSAPRVQGVDGAGQRRYVGYYSHILQKGFPPAPVTLFLSYVRVHTIPMIRKHASRSRTDGSSSGAEYAIKPFCLVETPQAATGNTLSTLDLAGLGKAARHLLRSWKRRRPSVGTDGENDDDEEKTLGGAFGRRPERLSGTYRSFDIDCFGMPLEGDCILRLRDAASSGKDVGFVCFNTDMLMHVAQTQAQQKTQRSKRAVVGSASRALVDDCRELVAHTFRVSASTRREQSQRLQVAQEAGSEASGSMHIGVDALLDTRGSARNSMRVSNTDAISSIMLSAERRAIDAEARGEDPDESARIVGVEGACHIPRRGIDVVNRDRDCEKYSPDFALELHFCTAVQAERIQGALHSYVQQHEHRAGGYSSRFTGRSGDLDSLPSERDDVRSVRSDVTRQPHRVVPGSRGSDGRPARSAATWDLESKFGVRGAQRIATAVRSVPGDAATVQAAEKALRAIRSRLSGRFAIEHKVQDGFSTSTGAGRANSSGDASALGQRKGTWHSGAASSIRMLKGETSQGQLSHGQPEAPRQLVQAPHSIGQDSRDEATQRSRLSAPVAALPSSGSGGLQPQRSVNDMGGASEKHPRPRRASLPNPSELSQQAAMGAASTQQSQSSHMTRKSSVRVFASGSGRAGIVRRGSVRLLAKDIKRLMVLGQGTGAAADAGDQAKSIGEGAATCGGRNGTVAEGRGGAASAVAQSGQFQQRDWQSGGGIATDPGALGKRFWGEDSDVGSKAIVADPGSTGGKEAARDKPVASYSPDGDTRDLAAKGAFAATSKTRSGEGHGLQTRRSRLKIEPDQAPAKQTRRGWAGISDVDLDVSSSQSEQGMSSSDGLGSKEGRRASLDVLPATDADGAASTDQSKQEDSEEREASSTSRALSPAFAVTAGWRNSRKKRDASADRLHSGSWSRVAVSKGAKTPIASNGMNAAGSKTDSPAAGRRRRRGKGVSAEGGGFFGGAGGDVAEGERERKAGVGKPNTRRARVDSSDDDDAAVRMLEEAHSRGAGSSRGGDRRESHRRHGSGRQAATERKGGQKVAQSRSGRRKSGRRGSAGEDSVGGVEAEGGSRRRTKERTREGGRYGKDRMHRRGGGSSFEEVDSRRATGVGKLRSGRERSRRRRRGGRRGSGGERGAGQVEEGDDDYAGLELN